MNCEKLRSPTRATFKNLKISSLIGRKLKFQHKVNTQKIRILNLWMNWGNLCPNLSFTVQNGVDNLHKIRLLTFEN